MPSNHICTLDKEKITVIILPPLPPNAPLTERLSRYCRRATLVTTHNPRCNLLFRSRAAVEYEQKRHVRTQGNVYMHPFSMFRMYWEVWMLFILLLSLIGIPLHCVINFNNSCRPFDTFADVILNILDFICIIDIIFTFNSGYIDTTTNEVILDKGKVFRNYMFGFFVLDLLSSIPSDVVQMLLHMRKLPVDDVSYQLYMQFLALLKIFKFNQFLQYMQCTADLYQLSQNMYAIMWFIIIPFLITHWVACLHYLVPTYVAAFYGALDRNSWIAQSKLKYKDGTTLYIACLFRACSYVMCIGHGGYRVVTREDTIVGIVSYIGGYVFNGFLFVMVMQLLISFRSSSTKYHCIMNQVNEYMRHKKLPMQMQKKLVTFYEYKYKKRYFREIGITDALSDRLKKEINFLSCQKFVESVPLLADLPEQLISKIITHLKIEVYLPNDVIVKAGTPGDSMYFISSGTVMVQTPNGKEICHLQEGAYFGEIALILKEQKRIATVIAIEICETFKLDKKSFRSCFADSTDAYKKLVALAEERLEKTVILEERHKKYMQEKTSTKK